MKNKESTIPKGWQKKKIKDLLIYERPDSYIVKNTSYSQNNKTPVLTANKSFVLGYTDEDFGICDNVPAIIFDDFTTDTKYVDFPFKIKSSAIKILRCVDKEANLKYIYELMKLIKFPVGNHKRYYISQYQNLEIAVPPIEEQKKIAEILTCVDEDIEKTDEMIKKTQKLKKGLMQDLLTKGIGHTEFKKTDLGEIPEEWTLIELGKLCDVRDGTHDSPKYISEGVPLITSKNLTNGKLDFSSAKLISREDYSNIEKRSSVDDGDIMFGMIGTIGNPVLIKKDREFAIKNVALIKFYGKDKSQISNYFLIQYLKSSLTNAQFSQELSGSTQKFISLNTIRKMFITVPDQREQKKIAEILSAVDDKIDIYKQIKRKLTELKKGLMQDLLSGEIRVKI